MMNRIATTRRAWLMAAVAWFFAPALAAAELPEVHVWKSPTCGCCAEWVDYLRANGFAVRVSDSGNAAMRARLGLPIRYGSCHTAKVGDYVVEGHVPADDIKRLLSEAPSAVGLAVPRMPIGSPGMDGPAYGGRVDPYDVLLIQRDGSARVFNTYGRQ